MGKKSSVVWEYFDVNREVAICRICKDKVKYVKRSTGTMFNHMKLKHTTNLNKPEKDQLTMKVFSVRKCDSARQEKFLLQ